MKNRSPWIFELKNTRKSYQLERDEKTDVVVVGAGIAGVSTAFFLLQETNKKIIIVDKYKLAHGATGHNAGHVEAYFERPFLDLVKEYGLKLTLEAQKNTEYGWELIDHMYNSAGLSIPFNRLMGNWGYISKEQIIELLEEKRLMREGGIHCENLLIADHLPFLDAIKQYEGFYELKPHKEILEIIESKDDQYIACDQLRSGTINSALFCENIVEYLEQKYSDRFHFYENTFIKKIILKEDQVLLDAETHEIVCDDVVLATNGFENFDIIYRNNLDIDTKFHRYVKGTVGYMSSYIQKKVAEPFSGGYFSEDPYFYITRRKYDFDKNSKVDMVSIGGPEIDLDDRKEYDRDYEYPEDAKEKVSEFLRKTYKLDPEKDFEQGFNWHGLMGYTSNMMRLIGNEPRNKRLLYNLGCNGVGILTSIFGGWKVSKIIAGEKFPPSIFDPKFMN